jgi:hypothetical protein
MAKEITLKAWASPRFDPVPTDKTLQRWARDCWIFPIPRKVGKHWRVREDARFIGPDASEIDNGSQAA